MQRGDGIKRADDGIRTGNDDTGDCIFLDLVRGGVLDPERVGCPLVDGYFLVQFNGGKCGGNNPAAIAPQRHVMLRFDNIPGQTTNGVDVRTPGGRGRQQAIAVHGEICMA